MRQYFGYIRVSTIRQGERGVSLQEQRDAILRYAASNGLEICDWYEEQLTAAKGGRPMFLKMIALVRRGRADGIVMHKIDRGARNLRDWANLAGLFDEGIDVRFAHESLDLSSRGGRLSADIQAVVAADYIRNLREEVCKGIRGRLKQGLLPWAAPIGYVDNGGGQLKTPCPVAGPLMREAFERYATGKYSLRTLLPILADKGLRTSTGRALTRGGLSSALSNPFYAGTILVKTSGEIYPGNHEPLVSQELFNQVQSVLAGRLPTKVRSHQFRYRKIFRCADCGRYLIGERHKRIYLHYRCQTKGCGVALQESYLDAAVERHLERIRLSERELGILEAEAKELAAESDTVLQEQLRTLKLQSSTLAERMERLHDAYLDRLFDQETFTARRSVLIEEQNLVKGKIRELEERCAENGLLALETLELAKTLALPYEMATDDEKRDLLKTVYLNCSVSGKNVYLTPYFFFDLLENRHGVLSGGPHRATTRTFFRNLMQAFLQLPDHIRNGINTALTDKEGKECLKRQFPVPQSHDILKA